ncbi:MAG: hypothetical protein HY578_10125, partial [Nitrospinae bacterium]|nr:hypothetical protein [Nitrospinota bacterium]
MRKYCWILCVIVALLTQQGCAVFMAARQPTKKDVSLFKAGTPRSLLIAEFGAPVTNEERDGRKYEIFKFTQGYSGPVKIGRTVFHGTADVFTLGLWEVVGTPTEMVFDGTETVYEVGYDENNCVASVNLLKQGTVKKIEKEE